jgi:hypothetical protein
VAPLTPQAVREVAEWMGHWSGDRVLETTWTRSPRIVAYQGNGFVVYEADSIRRLVPRPEICSQCGKPFSGTACGFAHVAIANERGHYGEAVGE